LRRRSIVVGGTSVTGGGCLVKLDVARVFRLRAVMNLGCAVMRSGSALIGFIGAKVCLSCALAGVFDPLRRRLGIVVGDGPALGQFGAPLGKLLGASLSASPGFFGHASRLNRPPVGCHGVPADVSALG
jgi:hypothetical protein